MKIPRRRKAARQSFALPRRTRPCSNCGQPGPHFVPPSLGDPGFFACDDNDAAAHRHIVEILGKLDPTLLKEYRARGIEAISPERWDELLKKHELKS